MRLNERPACGAFAAPPGRIALISAHASPLAAPGSAGYGGQNVYAANLAHALSLAGARVDIFTRRSAPAQAPIVHLCDKVRVIHVPAGPPRPLPVQALLPHVAHFAHFARFVTRFAGRQARPYDIVHANFFIAGMVAQQLKLALGIPYVITFHALGQVRRLAQGRADPFAAERVRIETALMRQADQIIAECTQDRLDMEQLYGAAPDRITVVPCGFDPDELWPVPRAMAHARLGLAAEKFTVLQLGRMAPRKGVDTVVQALATLRERHRVDAQLLVVGGDGDEHEDPELARLGALAHQLGVHAHLRFVGQQPRALLRLWYGAADVFVTTPWYEPFGITPVEAMACARPVIGSEVGGIKSTVVDGLTGFLIPSRDPRALAERLALLHADPAARQRMGESGLHRAWRHYTWRGVAQQSAAVYAAVHETRSAAASGITPL